MSTSGGEGRLGNQIIRNLAVSLLAEKHNLFVNYSCYNRILDLGINLFIGENKYNKTIVLDDDNYFSILNSTDLDSNIYPNSSYFQTNTITNHLHHYLHSNTIKTTIIQKNPFSERYNNNNDLLVHVRLSDASQWSPGIDYYLNTISKVTFDTLYIGTDEKDHAFIKKIVEKYPKAKLIEYGEIKTIQLASTCKNIILSHGTFSAVIGYLAFYSVVHYPEFTKTQWCGDIFSIKGWIKHDI